MQLCTKRGRKRREEEVHTNEEEEVTMCNQQWRSCGCKKVHEMLGNGHQCKFKRNGDPRSSHGPVHKKWKPQVQLCSSSRKMETPGPVMVQLQKNENHRPSYGPVQEKNGNHRPSYGPVQKNGNPGPVLVQLLKNIIIQV